MNDLPPHDVLPKSEDDSCFYCEEAVFDSPSLIWVPNLGGPGEQPERKPWHAECMSRSIIGGLNHLKCQCSCYGGTEPPDPPEMTRHEAALAAVEYYRDHHQKMH
jgi:hypothetical protein